MLSVYRHKALSHHKALSCKCCWHCFFPCEHWSYLPRKNVQQVPIIIKLGPMYLRLWHFWNEAQTVRLYISVPFSGAASAQALHQRMNASCTRSKTPGQTRVPRTSGAWELDLDPYVFGYIIWYITPDYPILPTDQPGLRGCVVRAWDSTYTGELYWSQFLHINQLFAIKMGFVSKVFSISWKAYIIENELHFYILKLLPNI